MYTATLPLSLEKENIYSLEYQKYIQNLRAKSSFNSLIWKTNIKNTLHLISEGNGDVRECPL